MIGWMFLTVALCFLVGHLVTVVTYQAASKSGGHYLVAWGAILFGGLQFLRGLVRAGGE